MKIFIYSDFDIYRFFIAQEKVWVYVTWAIATMYANMYAPTKNTLREEDLALMNQ